MDLNSHPRLRQELTQAHQAALRAERAQDRLAHAAHTTPPAAAEVRTLPVAGLARRCTAETRRDAPEAPAAGSCGLELFRRAIVEHDEAAWSAVYAQYEDLVRHWLRAWGSASEDAVIVTFTLFWRAMDPAKLAGFPALGAVLHYLKRCARTALRAGGPAHRAEPLDDTVASLSTHEDVEESVAARLEAPAFWRLVRTCCTAEREWMVLYLTCVRGLSPRQIQRYYPAQFPAIGEVYQLKRNVLARLRRRPEVRARALG